MHTFHGWILQTVTVLALHWIFLHICRPHWLNWHPRIAASILGAIGAKLGIVGMLPCPLSCTNLDCLESSDGGVGQTPGQPKIEVGHSPGFYNGISTAEVDTLAAETCSSDWCFLDGWDSVSVHPLLFMFGHLCKTGNMHDHMISSVNVCSESAYIYIYVYIYIYIRMTEIFFSVTNASPLRSWDDHKVIWHQIWIWWTPWTPLASRCLHVSEASRLLHLGCT